jgi:hypothetical protein
VNATAYEAGAKLACSAIRLMANGDGSSRAVCMCLVSDGEVLVRDRGAAEGCAPCLHGGTWNLHVEPVTSSVRGCGSWDVSLACVRSSEMQSDCGGVSRMESCRGAGGVDGGADVSAEPCPNWVPFSRFDGRPGTLHGCDDACDLC